MLVLAIVGVALLALLCVLIYMVWRTTAAYRATDDVEGAADNSVKERLKSAADIIEETTHQIDAARSDSRQTMRQIQRELELLRRGKE